MEEILLRVGSKESYEAIKSFTAQLQDVELVEELPNEGFPFSKAESDRRMATSMQQYSEGKTISQSESKQRTSRFT